MRLRAAVFLILGGLGTWGILHAQKPFISYESTEEHAREHRPNETAVRPVCADNRDFSRHIYLHNVPQ